MTSPRRFAVIGYGAVTEELVACLEERGDLDALAAVLVRTAGLASATRRAEGRFPVVDRLEALLETEPDAVAECAGHDAVRQYGADVLARGIDLVISSTGALADRAFALTLCRSSAAGGRVWIPPGAVAGIDGLLAARTAGLRAVTYTCAKEPAAWVSTPAEHKLHGYARLTRTVIFEGSARTAALEYPRNANVAATVALAGLGLDDTHVQLVSDPDVPGPVGTIEARGDFGEFRCETLALATESNLKTSALTAHSIVSAVLDGIAFVPPPRLLC